MFVTEIKQRKIYRLQKSISFKEDVTMARRKKSAIKGLFKWLDDLSPSKQNPNIGKGTMRKRNSAKRRKKKGKIF